MNTSGVSAQAGSVKRRIFIGDVQGCRAELEELLMKLAFDPSADEVHPVGDFVNRGPDSAGVLRVCRAIGAGGVLGNHDVHLLRVAAGERRTGARDTLAELLAADDRATLLAWLAERPFGRTWSDVILVHAGLSPCWTDPTAELAKLDPLRAEPDLQFAISARYCDPEGRRAEVDWPPPPLPFRPWYEYFPGDPNETRTVVFGHWARQGLVVRPQVRGLDTGCVWGGKLTAWIAEEDRFVHVDAHRTWARHE